MTESFRPQERHEHTSDCVFCKIVKKEAPASVIEESENIIVFMSLEGYPLIVPKKHVQNYLDENLDEDTASEIGSALGRISRAVSKSFNTDSVSLVATNGEESGQEVMHLHFHTIPRFPEDNKVTFHHQQKRSRTELDEKAALIRENL